MDLVTFRRALQHRLAVEARARGLRRLDRKLLDEVTVRMAAEDLMPDGPLEGLFLELQHEAVLYGPLWQHIFDGTVSEIMINGHERLFVERDGVKYWEESVFETADALARTIDNLLKMDSTVRLDHARPWADISLPDGSRANIVIPPIARTPHLTIRKYQGTFKTLGDLIAVGTMDERIAHLLVAAVHGRSNMLFSGGTSTGKTTLVDVLARQIDKDERLVCIEDTPELHLDHPNVARLTTRLPNLEGKGEVTIGDLFRNALRMCPDRVLLGEIRGKEAFDYLQALNSGHDGSLAVLHASSPDEAAIRLQNLVPLAGLSVPPAVVKHQIALGLDLIVQMQQLADGRRKITRVTEVGGVGPDGELELRDLFVFEVTGRKDGEVQGRFVATGVVPAAIEDLKRADPSLRVELFQRG